MFKPCKDDLHSLRPCKSFFFCRRHSAWMNTLDTDKKSSGSWQAVFETWLTKSNFLLGHSQVRRGLARWPVVTNALTYGTLFCTAELTQQLLIKKYLPYKEVGESRIVDKKLFSEYNFVISYNKNNLCKYNWKLCKHKSDLWLENLCLLKKIPFQYSDLITKANRCTIFAKILNPSRCLIMFLQIWCM